MDMYRAVVSLEHRAQVAYIDHVYEDAIVFHSRAVALTAQPDDAGLTAVLFHRLGETLEVNGDMSDAVSAYEAGFQSLTTVKSLNIEQALVSLRAVGRRYYQFGQMTIPDCYDAVTAESLMTAITEPNLSARLLINCAEIHHRHSRTHLSLLTYKRALTQLRSAGTIELRMYALARLGTIAQRHGELATVQATLDEALHLRDSATAPQARCYILSALGNIY